MNMSMQKDSSFNRSFERENGLSMLLFDQNKMFADPSIYKNNSITNNGSMNFGFTPFVQK